MFSQADLDAGHTTASLYLWAHRNGYPLPTVADPDYRDWITVKPKGDGPRP